MKIVKCLALAGVAATVALGAPASAQRSNAPAAGPIAGQYVCVFDSNVVRRGQVTASANRAANAQGGQVLRVYQNSIHGFALRASANGIANMQRANPHIAYCVQDRVVTLAPPPGRGPGGGGDSGGGSTTQQTPWGITRVGGAVDGSNLARRAWVLDSGIDLDHPDLNVDTARSRDFTGSRRGADDENGHGTHVAGTIAAKNNSVGVIGVAAGAPVVAVRVLDRRGSGAYSGIIAGVDYVAGAAGVGDVANMSLGGGAYAPLNAAVEAAAAKGVHMVIAAGNDGANSANYSPASASGSRVYTISAIDQNDNLTSWSNYGAPVDWAEPGAGIPSTWKDGGYNTISGTSMAAPHAAGILLATGGTLRVDGYAGNDRDNQPDPIGRR